MPSPAMTAILWVTENLLLEEENRPPEWTADSTHRGSVCALRNYDGQRVAHDPGIVGHGQACDQKLPAKVEPRWGEHEGGGFRRPPSSWPDPASPVRPARIWRPKAALSVRSRRSEATEAQFGRQPLVA